jgi:hypothetical protein
MQHTWYTIETGGAVVSDTANRQEISPIPAPGVLLHIGPPKTGTTALQLTCHTLRASMLEQGVRYAGDEQQPSTAVFAVTRRRHPSTGMVPFLRDWAKLRNEVVNAKEQRVLVSSEFFAGATSEQAATVIRDLGGDRVQVLITLRPLAKILASRWQQNVQEGAAYTYVDWLTAVLKDRESELSQKFWSRQQHAELVSRWARVVGPDRVTVLVVDDAHRNALMRDVEQLLGLKSETLRLPVDLLNRSLTAPEAEAIRMFNVAFKAANLSNALRHKLMSRGGALLLKTRAAAPGEARILTPAWADVAAQNIAKEMMASIAASGVRVIGDLSLLTKGLDASAIGEMDDAAVKVAPETAASLALGVLIATGAARGYEHGSRVPAWAEPEELRRVPTRNLLSVAAQRQVQALLLRVRNLVQR